MKNRVIIISPHFPPSTLAGVHRARHLAKHLPAHGWEPVIVRTDARHYTERADPDLAALVPSSVKQVATAAFPARLTRIVGVGDIGIRAYWSLQAAALREAQRTNVAAVLITGAPFYPFLMSANLQRRAGIPVILDFQDPWVSAEGASRHWLSKGRLAHRLAQWLEPGAVRHADFITSVSAIQNRQLADRYPWFDDSRMDAIPIGGDPDDFEQLRSRPVETSVRLDRSRINISYVGTFLPRAGPLVRQVFRALKQLANQEPQLASKLNLNFVGTSNQPDAPDGGGAVSAIAQEEGVSELISETPRRVPFLHALSILANSDGLLMIGSDEPHYTASKIYPALMSGRPFMSLFHAQSSSHAILSAAGGGTCLAFNTAEELERLLPFLKDGLRRLAAQPNELGRADPRAYAEYTATAIAGRFANVFERSRQ